MIAGPRSPGLGAPVYQPAGNPVGGSCIVPSSCNPKPISAESTPIAGICTRTGTDRAIDATTPADDATPGATDAPQGVRAEAWGTEGGAEAWGTGAADPPAGVAGTPGAGVPATLPRPEPGGIELGDMELGGAELDCATVGGAVTGLRLMTIAEGDCGGAALDAAESMSVPAATVPSSAAIPINALKRAS